MLSSDADRMPQRNDKLESDSEFFINPCTECFLITYIDNAYLGQAIIVVYNIVLICLSLYIW